MCLIPNEVKERINLLLRGFGKEERERVNTSLLGFLFVGIMLWTLRLATMNTIPFPYVCYVILHLCKSATKIGGCKIIIIMAYENKYTTCLSVVIFANWTQNETSVLCLLPCIVGKKTVHQKSSISKFTVLINETG